MYLHYINTSEDVNPFITNLHFLNEFIHFVYLDDIWMYIYNIKRSRAEAPDLPKYISFTISLHQRTSF